MDMPPFLPETELEASRMGTNAGPSIALTRWCGRTGKTTRLAFARALQVGALRTGLARLEAPSGVEKDGTDLEQTSSPWAEMLRRPCATPQIPSRPASALGWHVKGVGKCRDRSMAECDDARDCGA
jgi:hypothetical protein